MIDRTVVGALLRRPHLWFEAIRFVMAASPDGWWRTLPFAPRVEERYASWRVATAHGSADVGATPHDVVAFLEWRKRQGRRI